MKRMTLTNLHDPVEPPCDDDCEGGLLQAVVWVGEEPGRSHQSVTGELRPVLLLQPEGEEAVGQSVLAGGGRGAGAPLQEGGQGLGELEVSAWAGTARYALDRGGCWGEVPPLVGGGGQGEGGR